MATSPWRASSSHVALLHTPRGRFLCTLEAPSSPCRASLLAHLPAIRGVAPRLLDLLDSAWDAISCRVGLSPGPYTL